LLAATLSGFLGVGCGPLSKPFKPDTNDGAPSPFDQLRDLSGVVVAPLENAPAGVGGPFADSVSKLLREANIPSTTGGALKDGFLLEGRARTITWGARHAIVIDWVLSDRLGAIVDQRATNKETDIPIRVNKGGWDAWRVTDDAALDKAAQTIAKVISRLLQQETPEDFVIATGKQYSVREFIELSAKKIGIIINFKGSGVEEVGYVIEIIGDNAPFVSVGDVLVKVDPAYFRPTEVETLLGSPKKAKDKLGWEPEIKVQEMCAEMVKHDLENAKKDILLKNNGYQINTPKE
jgi:hypothetical protein